MENSPKYGTTPPSKTTGYSVTRPHNPIHDIRLIIPALYLWGMTITVLHTGATGLIAYNAVLIGLSILGAGITLWKTRSAQPHKLALILLPLLITSLAGSLNLGLRLPLATQVTAGDVAEVKGRIITRPTTYPTTYPNARGERTRYLLSSPQGEITLIKRGEQPLGFVPGATVTVLAKNIEPPTHQLSQGEWNLITVRSVGKTRGVWRLSNAIYRRWDNALNIAEQGKLYTPDTHALARGLTIGDTSGLSFPKRDAYRAAGLSHLTAVSGANVAFLLIFVGTLLRHQTPRRKAAASISLLLVFVAVVGPEPSILRAAVSGSVGVLALYLGHRKQALPALGAGIILLLFLRPSFAVSPGFVLSVVATTGLILGARPLNTLLQAQHVPTYLADILAVSITAHLVTTPLTAYFFGTISTLGIIANILVAPLMPIVTAAGLIGIILSCINPLVGAVAAAAAWPAVRWVDLVGTIFGSGTWSQIILPPRCSKRTAGDGSSRHSCAMRNGTQNPHHVGHPASGGKWRHHLARTHTSPGHTLPHSRPHNHSRNTPPITRQPTRRTATRHPLHPAHQHTPKMPHTHPQWNTSITAPTRRNINARQRWQDLCHPHGTIEE